MNIKFFGATEMVTGSCHMIEAEGKKLLLDCGMFQGSRTEDLRNFDEFGFDPSEIDYLILSHAHIDHTGRVPLLVKRGFKGRILSVKATTDLSEIMLLDSAHIQEQDTEWENRKLQRRGEALKEPLYTVDDAKLSLKFFESYFYDQEINLDDIFTITFKDAGHILGSAIVEIIVKEKAGNTKIVFTGDLGVRRRPILKDPTIIDGCDYLIMESTYGDENHPELENSSKQLIEIIEQTAKRGGTTLIPSFAVGRTQEIIYELNAYYDNKELPAEMQIPIYIDSPMAIEATEAYNKNSELFDEETQELILSGDHPFKFPNLKYVKTVEESKMLNKTSFPCVIISASGMCDAGRIRHHIKHNAWNKKNSIVFVGYQAKGTTGRRILEGEKEIKILGELVQINAEIHSLEGFSAHADQKMLLDFIRGMKHKPKKIFIVHGEAPSNTVLKSKIEEEFKIDVTIPQFQDEFSIDRDELTHNRAYEPNIYEKQRDIKDTMQKIDKAYMNLINKDELLYEKNGLEENYAEYKKVLLELESKLMEINSLRSK
ncbi:MAG: MBL fold metallo-hydrolase [Tissierellia bacterium]|nr:MBL fold metallo-hydrolase [Tissierellia bacterium]